jgi:2-polyprenyl-3-methyl-5-hydroxy-6-metoxy-1,4-benzoquinol methylase
MEIKMKSGIEYHIEKIHNSGKEDFRWNNLRELVLKYVEGSSVLDAGCGTGHMTLKLLNEGHAVTAIDRSKELTKFTQEAVKQDNFKAEVYTLDLLNVDQLGINIYENVICLDVLEHIDNDELALQKLVSTLKKGGNLIFSVPACSFLYGTRDRDIGHYRRYDKKDLISLIKKADLEIKVIQYWNFLGFFPTLFSEKLLHRKISEEIRYSKKPHYICLNYLLNKWFFIVENNVRFSIGLSLIAICKKK